MFGFELLSTFNQNLHRNAGRKVEELIFLLLLSRLTMMLSVDINHCFFVVFFLGCDDEKCAYATKQAKILLYFAPNLYPFQTRTTIWTSWLLTNAVEKWPGNSRLRYASLPLHSEKETADAYNVAISSNSMSAICPIQFSARHHATLP